MVRSLGFTQWRHLNPHATEREPTRVYTNKFNTWDDVGLPRGCDQIEYQGHILIVKSKESYVMNESKYLYIGVNCLVGQSF